MTTINDARLGLVQINACIHAHFLDAPRAVEPMIKDVMVRLDGTVADDVRLAAAADIARHFGGYVIGLFLNILPPPVAADVGVDPTALLLEEARAAGDKIAELLAARLAQLDLPTDMRRCDIFASEIGSVSAREARLADVFVALRPNSVSRTSSSAPGGISFWFRRVSGERSASRRFSLPGTAAERRRGRWAEALPYLNTARGGTVCVVDDKPRVESQALLGSDAKKHLHHHGIDAVVHHERATMTSERRCWPKQAAAEPISWSWAVTDMDASANGCSVG